MSNRFEDEDFGFEEESFDDHYMVDPSEMDVNDDFDRIRLEEISIINQKINTIVLKHTLDLVQDSIFWKFKSPSKRLQILSDTYHALADLVKSQHE